MYTIIGSKKSRALRAIWMAEELELDYDHLPAAPRSADVVALNPAGKIPVLLEGDAAITDSTAIITYLADKHGAMTAPAGTLARASQDSMTQFLLDEFDAALWMAARHSFILPEELRQSAIKDSLRWEFERSQATLVARMGEGGFVCGAQMSVPDIILTHCGNWAATARFPIVENALIDYLDRMRARPAYQRAAA
ncbi:MAG: glutathione S-transferase family protein [Brevirhabdus sp.]